MRLLALLLLVAGCGGEEIEPVSSTPTSVFDPEAMAPVEAASDPMVAHRPSVVDCSPATWGPEGGGFEIQTGACNYAAFAQPSPMSAEAGDTLAFTLWHDALDAPAPATAHVAVWAGSSILWEALVAIPGPSNTLEAAVALPTTLRAGDPLGIHLHNHGFNSWRIVSMTLQR